MAISRSLMNRQLRANGGIMDVTPRENFGWGSSLKKFARKIIPNEVADIAVKAAPFVAPFNPALAGAMSGIGTFDQTGSIGDSLKAGAMNYGGGQLARYAGGAGMQGNPFAQGGAFTSGGFQGGFSSPIGTSTGLGKFFSNKGTQGVQGIDSGRAGDSASALLRSTANVPTEALANASDPLGSLIIDELSLVPNAINKTTVAKEPGFLKNMFDGISNQDYGKVAQTIGDGAKKFGKAMFTNKDGSIDKAAVLGAVAFTASYAEAKALAADAGVEITPEEYDESRKAEKQEEYAGYLTNFFGGQKDGGRIGYEGGANELIKDKLMEDIMPDTSTEEMIMIMTETGPKMIKKSDYEAMSGMFRDTTTSLYGDAARGRLVPEFANGGRIGFNDGGSVITLMDGTTVQIPDGAYDNGTFKDIIYSSSKGDLLREEIVRKLNFAKGGRVDRRFGSPEEGEGSGLMEMLSVDVDAGGDEEEDMLMADLSFSSAEKSFLFKNLAKLGGADRSVTMPKLYGILKNPNSPGNYNDARMLKAFIEIKMPGFADGGRIGYAFGTPENKAEGRDGTVMEMGIDNTIIENQDPELPMEGDLQANMSSSRIAQLIQTRDFLLSKDEDVSHIDAELASLGYSMRAEGGIMEAKVPTGQMRKNNAGVAERDYRQTGGFVPVGIKERADDVPAMLSKNEFVMTADAVRGLGNGSVEEGSKKLYNTMKQAEQVGKA